MQPSSSATSPVNAVFDGCYYYYLPWGGIKPCCNVDSHWEDIAFRLDQLNIISHICDELVNAACFSAPCDNNYSVEFRLQEKLSVTIIASAMTEASYKNFRFNIYPEIEVKHVFQIHARNEDVAFWKPEWQARIWQIFFLKHIPSFSRYHVSEYESSLCLAQLLSFTIVFNVNFRKKTWKKWSCSSRRIEASGKSHMPSFSCWIRCLLSAGLFRSKQSYDDVRWQRSLPIMNCIFNPSYPTLSQMY